MSDPTERSAVIPEDLPETGLESPVAEPGPTDAPLADVESAPALQPREGDGGMLT